MGSVGQLGLLNVVSIMTDLQSSAVVHLNNTKAAFIKFLKFSYPASRVTPDLIYENSYYPINE